MPGAEASLRRGRCTAAGPDRGRWRRCLSFVHVNDAAAATVSALKRGAAGVYNIVDDEPATVREWLPRYAELLGARRPFKVPRFMGRLGGGSYAVYLMTQQRGASNAKAREQLGWQPRYASWRDGFHAELATPAPMRDT